MIRANKSDVVCLAIRGFLIGCDASVHGDDHVRVAGMNKMFDGIEINSVAFFKATRDVMCVVFVSNRLKKPDPGNTTHRAIDVVVGVKCYFFVLQKCFMYGVQDIVKSVISIVELIYDCGVAISDNDLGEFSVGLRSAVCEADPVFESLSHE